MNRNEDSGGLAVYGKRAVASLLARSRTESVTDVLFVPVVLAVLFVYLSITSQYFLTSANIQNLLVQASILGIVAFGVTFVVFAGELDLSVGYGVALVSVVAALVIRDTGNVPLGLAVGLGAGLAVGLINGLVVTVLEVPAFIATFGMLVIAHGLALVLSDGGVVSGLPRSVGALTESDLLGLPVIIWTMFAVFLVLLFVQNHTALGVKVLAVGGNRAAARLSGMHVNRVRLCCFLISGATVAIGGLALMSRVESGQPNAGDLLPLEAIAAIVVGGNSILGGRGSVTRTLWGVLLITMIRNGLDLEGVDDNLKSIILGVVFITAASTEFVRGQFVKRRRRRSLAREGGQGTGSGSAISGSVGDA